MKKPKFIPEFNDIPSGRQKMPELPLEERQQNFKEVELGFDEETALKEASRCLSCRRCIGCGLCLAECDQAAIVYEETSEIVDIEADAAVLTSDGKLYNPDSKKELGYCEGPDIITSLEFERLMSPTGPFGGLLLRPSDGDMPGRIAFIQCVGSREEAIGANFCSVQCCSRTLTQAGLARRSDEEASGDIRVTVFHRGLRPVGKTGEQDLESIKQQDWISLIEADVVSVSQDAAGGPVTVSYTCGDKEKQDRFDMVVLAVGIHANKKAFRRLARPGDVRTNKFGFIEQGIGAILSAPEAVAYAGSIRGPRSDEASLIDAVAGASRVAGEVGGQARGPSRETGKGQAIFVCEYGLALAGKGRAEIDRIKDSLDVDGVFPLLCYQKGREAMHIGADRASGIIVVGCHPGSHERLFEDVLDLPSGSVGILGPEDVNGDLSKQVSTLGGRLASADAAARVLRPRRVVVMGGGVSGLAAARELLRRGVKVVLVEKDDQIGRTLHIAARAQGVDLDVVAGFIKGITEHPDATVLTASSVAAIERDEGNLLIEVTGRDGGKSLKAGAVLVATGARAFTPGAGVAGGCLTQADFTERVIKGEKAWRRVVMVQCVGARDREHPYCSRYCCKQALANALRYKSERSEAEITIVHRGIRVFGFEEDLYTDAMEQGIVFVQADGKPEIVAGESPKVTGKDVRGESFALDCDVVVLSVGHAHGRDQEEVSRTTGVPLDGLRFIESGDPWGRVFATPVDGVFVSGYARTPVIAEDAFIEGIGAAGSICAYLAT